MAVREVDSIDGSESIGRIDTRCADWDAQWGRKPTLLGTGTAPDRQPS